jgi:quinone-modifying oxidoreductase subunit QmoC
MTTRVDPELARSIKAYGAVNLDACFNCGNCTAICPLSGDGTPFPRSTVRMLQLGLADRLRQSPDPWLCYYCGECSETCPRAADPAETMMAARRWLTVQYGRAGAEGGLYTSTRHLWATILTRAAIPLLLLAAYHVATGFHDIITDRVAVNRFAPVAWVWAAVLVHFAFLGSRVVRGGLTMARWVLDGGAERPRIPLKLYVSELKTLVGEFFTQGRWRNCGAAHRRRWLDHLVLVSGYLIMLVLIVGLLGWFQTDEIHPIYHPQRWLGYYATLALIYGSVSMLVGRLRRQGQIHKHSHPTDWLFPAFILTGAVTGILVHAFRYAGWPVPTYVAYTVHVMAMVSMLDVEVGIGKWMHLVYRPLALYLQRIKQRVPVAQAAGAVAGTAA